MKKATHPLYTDTTITCVCGATYEVGSTVADQRVDICSSCHPFFTGKQKLVDTEGRVERFMKRYANAGKGKKKK